MLWQRVMEKKEMGKNGGEMVLRHKRLTVAYFTQEEITLKLKEFYKHL